MQEYVKAKARCMLFNRLNLRDSWERAGRKCRLRPAALGTAAHCTWPSTSDIGTSRVPLYCHCAASIIGATRSRRLRAGTASIGDIGSLRLQAGLSICIALVEPSAPSATGRKPVPNIAGASVQILGRADSEHGLPESRGQSAKGGEPKGRQELPRLVLAKAWDCRTLHLPKIALEETCTGREVHLPILVFAACTRSFVCVVPLTLCCSTCSAESRRRRGSSSPPRALFLKAAAIRFLLFSDQEIAPQSFTDLHH